MDLERGLYYLCSENRGADISFAVTAKLICVFVFAYAKSRFSHDAAHLLMKECAMTSGLLLGFSLSRKSVIKITDNPDMTSAVYREHKATNQSMIYAA